MTSVTRQGGSTGHRQFQGIDEMPVPAPLLGLISDCFSGAVFETYYGTAEDCLRDTCNIFL